MSAAGRLKQAREENFELREIILLYNAKDPERAWLIKKAINSLGIAVEHVARRDYLKPVGTLAGEKLFLTIEKEYDGPELDDIMMVMAGLSGERLDQVLKALRESGAGNIAYKAVLTQTNQFWTSLMLYEELKKEHVAFAERGKR